MLTTALIPAAGRGLRLDRPRTPKPLVDVGGLPMLIRLIGQLERRGVERIVVITGYDGARVARAVAGHPWTAAIRVVHNDGWERGQPVSVLAGRDEVDGPFLLAMADHVFDDAILDRAVRDAPPEDGVTAFVDPRTGDVFDLASAVKIRRRGDLVEEIGRDLERFDAVDMGLFAAGPVLFEAIERELKAGPRDDLSLPLGRLARVGAVHAVEAQGGGWDDVDTPAGLVHAEMRLRRERRAGRLKAPPGPIPSAAIREEHDFAPPPAVATRIVIGRGLVGRAGVIPLLGEASASSPLFLFTDETVHGLYGRAFAEALRSSGRDTHEIVLPDGEESKSLASYCYLTERVLARGVDERSLFVSLGGGVVCNVCGFVASTIYRGMDLIHLPTTLMAQCDAAISHKQAINGRQGKNLVGSYYLPRLVAVDVEVLATLDDRLVRDGLAEAIKHALCQDRDYVALLLERAADPRDPDFLEEVVRRNVRLKCALAASDPREKREGLALQYGHAVGHAVEHLSHYELYHGESVAVGMMVTARVGRLLGACDDGLVALHRELLERYGLPTRIPEGIRTDDILTALQHDKSYLVEGPRMPILAAAGDPWTVGGDFAIPISDAVLTEAIDACRGGTT
jgi:3-dehydroquinate synthase